ncbi:MAG: glycine dehydrogenase subunit 2, partial [Planctomycetia bacterium]|nr:glycine dehydrogenase subunit 2 [Planctomycetia bacterium]
MLADPKRSERFHQAQWQEPIILQLSTPGERGVVVEEAEAGIQAEVGDGVSRVPPALRRATPPALPEMAQMRVLRHYLRLSQETLGADLNVDIGQGTCTMKYSPKVQEQLVSTHKVTELHPLQDDSTVQGSLEILYQTDLYLREVSGLDRFTFQPRSGTQGILTMASIIRAYHHARGEGGTRDEIVTTIFSHPSD